MRNGALLDKQGKEKLKEIDKKLSDLSLSFGDNLLADSNDYKMVVERKEDLAGLPENVLEAAQIAAKEKGEEGKWVFTLDFSQLHPLHDLCGQSPPTGNPVQGHGPTFLPGNKWDNREIIKEMAQLRKERAGLLGYPTHAHFVLEERMAETPEKVDSFLNELREASLAPAQREIEELKSFAKENGFAEELQRWDMAYWSEKLKKSLFNLDDETLRPYFQLDNVVKGIFQTARKLYGIDFQEKKDIPVYHPEVKVYEVTDSIRRNRRTLLHRSLPRPGKRNGAWATTFRNQHKTGGQNHPPRVSIVCNFTRPTPSRPSLLNFREVTTLFHEFGHALHMLMSDCRYRGLSGASVYWDFVELPSQIMENWPKERECLELFATHFESGEVIPPEMIKKIAESASFQEGLATIRQVGLALLDMAWHWERDRIRKKSGTSSNLKKTFLPPSNSLPPPSKAAQPQSRPPSCISSLEVFQPVITATNGLKCSMPTLLNFSKKRVFLIGKLAKNSGGKSCKREQVNTPQSSTNVSGEENPIPRLY